MPNLRAQIVGQLGSHAPSAAAGDQVGIWMQASNGKTFTLTKKQLLAQVVAAVGSRAVKRATVMAAIKVAIQNALGAEQVDLAGLVLDFDDADGTPSQVEVS